MLKNWSITMAGLLLIFLGILYASVVVMLLVRVKPIWGKALVLVAAILIPTADDFYYRKKLDAYCKNEAGFKIYQQVSRKEGLVDSFAVNPDYLEIVPLAYAERHDDSLQKNYRLERQPDGSIKKFEIQELSAKYELVKNDIYKGPFLKRQFSIKNRQTGEKLGEFLSLYYYGGWFQGKLLGGLTGGGHGSLVADCGYEGKSAPENDLIKRVFSKD